MATTDKPRAATSKDGCGASEHTPKLHVAKTSVPDPTAFLDIREDHAILATVWISDKEDQQEIDAQERLAQLFASAPALLAALEGLCHVADDPTRCHYRHVEYGPNPDGKDASSIAYMGYAIKRRDFLDIVTAARSAISQARCAKPE